MSVIQKINEIAKADAKLWDEPRESPTNIQKEARGIAKADFDNLIADYDAYCIAFESAKAEQED